VVQKAQPAGVVLLLQTPHHARLPVAAGHSSGHMAAAQQFINKIKQATRDLSGVGRCTSAACQQNGSGA
jgi:hypothetical protein